MLNKKNASGSYLILVFFIILFLSLMPGCLGKNDFVTASGKKVTTKSESNYTSLNTETTETAKSSNTQNTNDIKPMDNLLNKNIKIFKHGNREKMEVALTFDACMTTSMLDKLKNGKVSSYYNEKVTEILNLNNIDATFFICGLWAQYYKEIVKSLAENPNFEIENHSYFHYAYTSNSYKLPVLAENEKKSDITLSQNVLKEITGTEPKFFRFPGGFYSDSDIALVRSFGLTVVGWDVVSGDAFNNNTKNIVSNVEKGLEPGSIIVMHINDSTNAPKTHEALQEIINFAKKNGYQFVKISDLVNDFEIK
jgi:peptidoglycan/xylan/chitin deacetylase (PgdA/CDA1 family)